MAKVRELLKPLSSFYSHLQLPAVAKHERYVDYCGLPDEDPGVDRAIDEGVAWLSRAQDHSTSHDGGVARHWSLIDGWAASYPETTGYIIPTVLTYSQLREDEAASQRARRMLDWLISIQLPDGGFQGGLINSRPVIPVTFNTGQILLGLVSGVRAFGEDYCRAMYRAADWLVGTQDPDGCWRQHPTPFAAAGEKAYETHVAWALVEAARLTPQKSYADAAFANVRWALRLQQENGWFDKCCLTDPSQPLTHTLGYVLRGILEVYLFTREKSLLDACRRTADGLLAAVQEDGFLPGRLNRHWQGTVQWVCLTGSVQIALCWFLLYEQTGERRYRDAGYTVNRYVRRTMKKDGASEVRGAIKGSFPISGEYGTYQYLSWACKFFVDANMMEKTIREREDGSK